MIKLFKNQTANGFSSIFQLTADKAKRVNYQDNLRVICPTGVFGGATITLRVGATEDGRFSTITNGAITTDAAQKENLPNELFVQAEITGATGTTDLDFYIV